MFMLFVIYLWIVGGIIVGQFKVLIPLVSMLCLAAIFAAISATRPRADVAYCIHALARRLSKTHNWAVCAPVLDLVLNMTFFYMDMKSCQYIHSKTWNAWWNFYEFIICCFYSFVAKVVEMKYYIHESYTWIIMRPSLLEVVLWFSLLTLLANKSGIKNNTKIVNVNESSPRMCLMTMTISIVAKTRSFHLVLKLLYCVRYICMATSAVLS